MQQQQSNHQNSFSLRGVLRRLYLFLDRKGADSEQFRMLSRYMWILKEYRERTRIEESDCDVGGHVKLYYFRLNPKAEDDSGENLGDYLSKVVVSYFAPKGINANENRPYQTLFAVGSVLGFRCQNAVVWGSGILSPDRPTQMSIRLSSLDIRAVRGPNTRRLLLKQHKKCPEIYGDPAILMPLIYQPLKTEKRYRVSVVFHHTNRHFSIPDGTEVNRINIITSDYRHFIDQVVQSEVVITSSLHGVILSEAYGVPAVLLLKEGQSVFKYEDWYYSTGRYQITVAHSIEEALSVTPMALPDLTDMRQKLLEAFPCDLWNDERQK